VAEVELNCRVIGPLESVHPELGPNEMLGCWEPIDVGDTQHQKRAVAEEDKFAAGPQ
jgi:hypothetical protein